MNHDNILAYLKVGFDCLAPNKISRITVSGDAVMVGNGNLTAII